MVDYYWKSNNYGDRKGIKHLTYDGSKGARYYVNKYYDRNIDNDIFVWLYQKINLGLISKN